MRKSLSPSFKAAFTLLELLLVLLLIGLIYGLMLTGTFFKNTAEPNGPTLLKLKNLPDYFRKLDRYKQEPCTLYMTARRGALLVCGDEIEENLSLAVPTDLKAYTLLPDETLLPIEQTHLKLSVGDVAILWRIDLNVKGRLSPAYFQTGDRWLYLHPTRGLFRFPNAEEMIRFVRATPYLPDRGGYAQ